MAMMMMVKVSLCVFVYIGNKLQVNKKLAKALVYVSSALLLHLISLIIDFVVINSDSDIAIEPYFLILSFKDFELWKQIPPMLFLLVEKAQHTSSNT